MDVSHRIKSAKYTAIKCGPCGSLICGLRPDFFASRRRAAGEMMGCGKPVSLISPSLSRDRDEINVDMRNKKLYNM